MSIDTPCIDSTWFFSSESGDNSFAIDGPSKLEYIEIDDMGRVGNDGGEGGAGVWLGNLMTKLMTGTLPIQRRFC
jgi:hypothetical protein